MRAQALAYFFMTGGVVGALTLLFPHDEALRDAPIFGLAALAAAVGLVVHLRAETIGEAALHLALAAGILIVSAANYFVGTTALFPILYTWTALYAFTCFALRPALLHWSLAAACYVTLLAIQSPPSPVTRWLLAMGTPLVAGVLISWLFDRLGREAERTAERTRVLGESEERTRAIVEAAPDSFMTIEEDGRVASWNRAAERMFLQPTDKALGRPVGELVFGTDDERSANDERRRMLFEELEDGSSAHYEAELVRGDGSRFPAELSVSRVRVDQRGLLAVFVRDLSGREQRQREREELLREQAARAEAEQMAEMVHGLQALLDAALAHGRLEGMLAALVPRVCEVLSAEAATFLLAEEDGTLVVRASTAEQPGGEPTRVRLGEGISGKTAQLGEPRLIQDPFPDEAVDPAMRGMSSVLSVPLMAGGAVSGVIQVGVTAPRRFGDDDLLLLGLAADRVALAIDHARVYEREHRIAETLQRSLLPDHLPRLPGLQVAARYLAAASESEVGGDWYDVIPIDSGRVGLVMSDVAGKGLAAASMVGLLRSAMRAYALEGHDPPTVVERLNQLVFSEVEESQIATLVYAMIDEDQQTLSWVNAGHLPPLLLEGGRSRFLDATGSVPLGVMPYATYEQASIELPAGATLLLYTDGLVERPGEVLDEGLGRLAATLAAAASEPERLCDEVLARLVPGGAAADDVALLALHSPALGECLSLRMPPDPAELAPMRALLRRWLSQAEGNDEDVAEILAATGEAAANAIEHGGRGADGPFQVQAMVDAGQVQITVRDHGSWRAESPDSGRGRGLGLMRELMDDVEVIAGPQGTIVRMWRRLSNGAPGGGRDGVR